MNTMPCKKIILTATALLIMIPSVAHASSQAIVSVNGMVCDFCARALEKVFKKEEAVYDIQVDLNEKTITVTFKDQQNIDDEHLNKLITNSGYAVVNIKRKDKGSHE